MVDAKRRDLRRAAAVAVELHADAEIASGKIADDQARPLYKGHEETLAVLDCGEVEQRHGEGYFGGDGDPGAARRVRGQRWGIYSTEDMRKPLERGWGGREIGDVVGCREPDQNATARRQDCFEEEAMPDGLICTAVEGDGRGGCSLADSSERVERERHKGVHLCAEGIVRCRVKAMHEGAGIVALQDVGIAGGY